MKPLIYQLCLIAFLLGIKPTPAHAQQVPTYEWVWAGGGSTTNPRVGSIGIAVDSVGNSYTVGTFIGTVVFETHTFVCQSTRYADMYLAKHSPQGQLLWIQQISGPQVKEATDITVDMTGNLFLCGRFSDSITIGNTTLVGNGYNYSDTFLAKFTPQGTLLWARQSTSANWSSVTGRSLATDRAGNVYLAGEMFGQVSFDQVHFNNPPLGPSENFLAFYNAQGVLQWVKTGFGIGGMCITISNDGALYVAANYNNSLTLGGYTLPPPSASSSFTLQAGLYLAKFDAQLNCQWVRYGATAVNYPINPFCRGLTAAPGSGGVVCSVIFGGPTVFDGRTFNCTGGCFPISMGLNTGSDALILKYDAQGHFIWHQQVGGPLPPPGGGPNSFITQATDIANRAAIDAKGNIYVLLQLYGMPTLTTSVASSGKWYRHLVSYTPVGAMRWARPFSSTGYDGPNDVACSPSGQLYATGYTYGPTQFDNLAPPVTGVYNVFVAKLTNPPGADDETNLTNLLIPTIITPNGDQQNETFYLRGLPPGPWQLTIFNRWGTCVYHSEDYRQDWNAPGLPDGQYYYYMQTPYRPAIKGWLEVIH